MTKSRRRQHKVVIEQRIGPWQVQLAWPDDADQGGPTAIVIKPYPEVDDDILIGGLSSTVLRQIDFRTARDKWLEAKEKYLDPDDGLEHLRKDQLRKILERDGVTDTYLAFLANAYVQLSRTGERSIAKNLAEMTGRSPDTMKQHLHRVRKEQMLTAIPGKAGGQLTQKAIETIRAASRQNATDDGFVPGT